MWIDPKTRQVAQTDAEVRALRPNWSGPIEFSGQMAADLGFTPVAATAPDYDPIYQSATPAPPALVNGAWVQQWKIAGLSPDRISANLAAARAAKDAEINAAWLAANLDHFTYAGKRIACDEVGHQNILSTNGYIALFGEFAQDWPGGWKTMDKDYVPITTIDQWKAFYSAMVGQGNANFKRAQELKAQLDSATTAAQIAAIQWAP